MLRFMSQPERKSFQDLLSAVPLDARGDLAVLRSVFEEFMLQTPLPADVSLTEMTLGGVPVLEISVPEAIADATLLYFHGGVFALGSARASAGLASPARAAGPREGALRRLPARPEHPYPAATDDAVGSYRGLLETGSARAGSACSASRPAARWRWARSLPRVMPGSRSRCRGLVLTVARSDPLRREHGVEGRRGLGAGAGPAPTQRFRLRRWRRSSGRRAQSAVRRSARDRTASHPMWFERGVIG